MNETAVMHEIMIALSAVGCKVFRVNAGEGWTGEWRTVGDRKVIINNARRFRTGVPAGFSDLIVCCPNGQVIFMEVKTPTGRPSDEQKHFQATMRRINCRAEIVHGVQEARDAVDKAMRAGDSGKLYERAAGAFVTDKRQIYEYIRKGLERNGI